MKAKSNSSVTTLLPEQNSQRNPASSVLLNESSVTISSTKYIEILFSHEVELAWSREFQKCCRTIVLYWSIVHRVYTDFVLRQDKITREEVEKPNREEKDYHHFHPQLNVTRYKKMFLWRHASVANQTFSSLESCPWMTTHDAEKGINNPRCTELNS